jgi:hypothetical protein
MGAYRKKTSNLGYVYARRGTWFDGGSETGGEDVVERKEGRKGKRNERCTQTGEPRRSTAQHTPGTWEEEGGAQ